MAAMISLVTFGNNDLGWELSQSDSLLTHDYEPSKTARKKY